MVYVPAPKRMLLEEVEARWPALVPGLVAHPGVGFVSALGEDGPVAVGELGRRDLSTGAVEGIDPLLTYGDHAPELLRRRPGWPGPPSSTSTAASTSTRWTWRPSNRWSAARWPRRVAGPRVRAGTSHLLAPSEPIMGGDSCTGTSSASSRRWDTAPSFRGAHRDTVRDHHSVPHDLLFVTGAAR